jgi:hypothetical protein
MTSLEHELLSSTTKVTFECGCWFVISDDVVERAPRDLDCSFEELYTRVEQAHEHGAGPHRLECMFERREAGAQWNLVVRAHVAPEFDPRHAAMLTKLDAVTHGLAPRVCEACRTAIPRGQPITACIDGRVLCSQCRRRRR